MSGLNALIDSKDYEAYRALLAGLESGEVDAHRFVGERLKLGVYAQRQDGLCMVRTKLPGGKLTPRQLIGFAEALEHYSESDVVHISTRQNIQFHNVPLKRTPDLLEHLALFGVGSREAGGNTVRNITACTLSGVCPREHTDVHPYLQRVARYFVRHPLTQALPRKFKMSFSACETDCAQGMIHDLAVVATRHNGEPGFKVLVGGGLGAKPRPAVVVDEFVTESDLIPAIEAVLRLHDRYSDRTRKAKSRIKFLIERFGREEFVRLYHEELALTSAAFDTAGQPRGQWRTPELTVRIEADGAPRRPQSQHQAGLYAVPVHVPSGDLNSGHLRGLARVLNRFDLDDLRTAQDQNLVVVNVPEARLEAFKSALLEIGLGVPAAGDRVVACPGTATCTLGITASSRIATQIDGGESDLSIRINGCQNSCANSDLADIGFYGSGKRHHGKLIPSYTLQLGGSGLAGGAFAEDGPDIPAARLPNAVKRIEESFRTDRTTEENFFAWSRRKGIAYFEALLADLSEVSAFELPFLLRDFGDSKVFAVESVGVGECAGATADPFDKALLDANYELGLRNAFAAKGKFEQALESQENALRLAGIALAIRHDETLDSQSLRHTIGQLHTIERINEELVTELEGIASTLAEQKIAVDELAFPQLAKRADAWIGQVKQLNGAVPNLPGADARIAV